MSAYGLRKLGDWLPDRFDVVEARAALTDPSRALCAFEASSDYVGSTTGFWRRYDAASADRHATREARRRLRHWIALWEQREVEKCRAETARVERVVEPPVSMRWDGGVSAPPAFPRHPPSFDDPAPIVTAIENAKSWICGFIGLATLAIVLAVVGQ